MPQNICADEPQKRQLKKFFSLFSMLDTHLSEILWLMAIYKVRHYHWSVLYKRIKVCYMYSVSTAHCQFLFLKVHRKCTDSHRLLFYNVLPF